MRICPVCGETNEDWMDICQRCGNSLNKEDNALPFDYTKNQSNYDNYMNDYNSYNYNNNYNYNNGYDNYGYNDNYSQDVSKNDGSNSQKKPSQNTDLKLLLIVLLIILFILIIVAYTMFS